MQIGFIGAGLMSTPMVENLIADGHSVTVWNRTHAKAAALETCGALAVRTAAEVCTPGSLVLSCLADDTALEAVFADGSVIAALGDGGLHVSMSTISAACSERLEAEHSRVGVAYVAAPVLGRPDAVKARVQSFVIAGADASKGRVTGILEALGRKVYDFGERASAANIAKINFNFLILSAVEAMAEAFAVVEKSGLDPNAFYEMVATSAFACPLYKNYGQLLVNKDWDTPAFRLELGLKDVGLAQSNAAARDARMRLGELLQDRFEQAIAHGLGEKDWIAVALDIRAEVGLEG